MRRAVFAGVYVLVAVAPAAAAPDPAVEAIRKIEIDLVAAARARDVERVLSHYAADAEIRSPGEDIQGLAALRAHLLPLKTAKRVEVTRTPDRIRAGSTTAYVSGRFSNLYQGLGSQTVTIVKGTYLTVYQRGRDGKWRISADMTAPSPP